MNRTLVWHLAFRYLRGRRTLNAVPLLSRISMAAIAVGAGAMIILFSVFNGFENLVKDLYRAFYPEIKISPAKGKFFSLSPAQEKAIAGTQDVGHVSYSISDNVLITSGEDQYVATLKGIDRNYFKVNDVLPYIVAGRDSITDSPNHTAIIGEHIANQMGLDVDNAFTKLTLYYPNASVVNPILNPESAFQALVLKPDGVFHIQDDFDAKYVLATFSSVQGLFNEQGKYSSIEISLNKGANPDEVKQRLQKIAGAAYKVETRYEQNKTLYMVMRVEKWIVGGILLLVLIIASFNMVGALSMLVLAKQKDMAILKAMGAGRNTIRGIFLAEGVLWALTGGLIGLLLGTILCICQQQFHWVKIGGAFVVDAYPVHFQFLDFIVVIATIILVGLLAAWYPAMKASKTEIIDLKST
ncbi:MAG: FtsX-like permease family protein [Flavipsychrobacter sp.]